MDVFTEILKLGVGGIFGAVFAWLYFDERKEHKVTRGLYTDLLKARRADSQSNRKLTAAVSKMATGMKAISDKIEISKGNK